MATTNRTLSPGGALLRASRMFSLPAALPAPPAWPASGAYNSDTATQTFPTLQTVTSPDNFRQRGDWGFKRNFPLRSTARTSTPYLRIKQVDSVEHVTDYSSAADHTLSLEKFQEMNVVISLPRPPYNPADGTPRHMRPVKSVFEDKHDFTVLDKEKIVKAAHRRWKYQGPWLAKMTEGDFQSYIRKKVRGRRTEFREFLRVQLAPTLTQEARARNMAEGRDQEVAEIRPEDVTDEQIMRFLQAGREEKRTKLYEYVSKFLDLAPCTPDQTTHDYVGMTQGEKKDYYAEDTYAKTGPPITHPSAGLSYLRTDAYLENHPLYGPQKFHRPVKARMVSLRAGNPMVGIGGFVGVSDAARVAFNSHGGLLAHAHRDPGGPRLWTHVSSAHVDSSGRTILHVMHADSDAQQIEQERQGETRVFHGKTIDEQLAHKKLRDEHNRPENWGARPRGPKVGKGLDAKLAPWVEAAGASSFGVNRTTQGDSEWVEDRGEGNTW